MKQKAKILIIDDSPAVIDILSRILIEDYEVQVANNPLKGLALAQNKPAPDLILLDILMVEMSGYEVCKILKKDRRTQNIPVIFITALEDVENETLAFEAGGEDYINKPVNPAVVKARVKTHIALSNQRIVLEDAVSERTKELNETRMLTIRKLGRAGEFRDNETGYHVIRMSKYSRLLALEAGLDNAMADLVLNAAPMHDIGKIGIPDNILLKPGKLDAEEWTMMKRHVEFGAEIIGQHKAPLFQLAREIILSHHEKWDGSGYPDGLSGENIPLVGRIVAIADVFDALTSVRSYKKAWSVEESLKYLKENSGLHFDPELIPLFFKILPEVLRIKRQFLDE